ncbi:cytochrome d ubiquinol oxidase subunit II [Desulfovibrio inopinatus]|uniref:cytochrome d ubiquinol oxidase subunit II n=1 Tax=Desulfovibrio inopinatus TaxID=102109 RepID=UPI00048431A2|nr:cytochrome d ubiquinol oxidase subunit II [Desulfovibrio inopinatus]
MLESTWFFLWGLLWAVYFMLDGFDLGAGTLMPFMAKNETEKRMMYNSVGPFWDGNEVWLIAAGGVTFAAFPKTYAVLFSGLYSALMLLLFALILRGVSFEFRSKIESKTWKGFFDLLQFLGSFLPALLLGVAFANIFMGIAIDANGVNQEGLFHLLNPYGLAGGVFFVVMFALHGALWIGIKTQGDIKLRAVRFAVGLWPVLACLTALFLAMSAGFTELFQNYIDMPVLFLVLLVPVGGLIMIRHFLGQINMLKAWISSAVFIVGVTFFGIIGLYPKLLPSTLDPAYSMTITNSSSSTLTLQIMLGVALVFVPIVILYQFWAYRTFGHVLEQKDLDHDEAY